MKSWPRRPEKKKSPSERVSIRVMMEHPETLPDFLLKRLAPDSPVLANIGAAQLLEYEPEKILDAVESIAADGLYVHLNAAQEFFSDRRRKDIHRLEERNLQTFGRGRPSRHSHPHQGNRSGDSARRRTSPSEIRSRLPGHRRDGRNGLDCRGILPLGRMEKKECAILYRLGVFHRGTSFGLQADFPRGRRIRPNGCGPNHRLRGPENPSGFCRFAFMRRLFGRGGLYRLPEWRPQEVRRP